MSQALHAEVQALLNARPGDASWCSATLAPFGRAPLGSGSRAPELPLYPFIHTKRSGDISQQAQKA